MRQNGRLPPGPFVLWALCIVVGIVAGLGAVAFRALIAFFHNLLFLGEFSAAYDANVHTPPSPWGPFVILVPVVGAAGVAFLVKTFAPEAKGHGVPEVMDAVYHHRGIIRPVVSVVKALASALSIGSGGSIGREGPIIQIGSSFGSTLGQRLKMPVWQLVTLIAAGAGGGIGATFNTPAGGVLFAVEIVLLEVSARTLVPVMTATAVATYVGQVFFGSHPSFFVPAMETPSFAWTRAELIAYAGLGVVAGLISALFVWSIYACEAFFEKRVKGGYYVQHMTGMLAVGVLMYALLRGWGHYYVQGVGYAAIQDVLGDIGLPLGLLAILFGAKLLATSLTLGSGASGGVFSPSLFLGATAGGAWGDALNLLFPALHVGAAAFAIAGMGGVVGGATGAALTAIVMTFEMTRDADAILPLVLTVAISYGVRRALIRDSIYTRKLTLRGESVPQSMRADLTFSRSAAEVMRPLSGEAAAAWTGSSGAPPGYIFVPAHLSLAEVVRRMRATGAPVALVAQDGSGDVKGTITREDIVDSLAADTELFGF
jgi:chloride channel protein, CIC family